MNGAFMGRSTPTTGFNGAMILCLYNVDTLSLCMKEFSLEKIPYNVKPLNIHVCMKEFGSKCFFFFDKMTSMRTYETIFPI